MLVKETADMVPAVLAMDSDTGESTLASTCHAVAGGAITDEFLEWPADLFALTEVILERSEQLRSHVRR